MAIRFTGILGGQPSDLCPVLISPNHDIAEKAVPDATGAVARRVAGVTRLAGAESAFHSAKESLAAPFTLAEAAGWVAALLAAAKTLTPSLASGIRRRLRTRSRRRPRPSSTWRRCRAAQVPSPRWLSPRWV